MVDSEVECPGGRAGPSWAPHASEAGGSATCEGGGGEPAPVWGVIRGCANEGISHSVGLDILLRRRGPCRALRAGLVRRRLADVLGMLVDALGHSLPGGGLPRRMPGLRRAQVLALGGSVYVLGLVDGLAARLLRLLLVLCHVYLLLGAMPATRPPPPPAHGARDRRSPVPPGFAGCAPTALPPRGRRAPPPPPARRRSRPSPPWRARAPAPRAAPRSRWPSCRWLTAPARRHARGRRRSPGAGRSPPCRCRWRSL